jgi:CDP-paratose 2-epimerase
MKWLITGGAGFIGTNLTMRLDAESQQVTIVDDLSREGSSVNWDYLANHSSCTLLRGSVSDPAFVAQLSRECAPDVIVHLAGQVSLMRSIEDPMADFESNIRGTLLILEQVRHSWNGARLIFSSTNKVYGDLEEFDYGRGPTRYTNQTLEEGVDIDVPLNFHGPYSCSKGAADQYVQDYHRIYGVDSVVLRQSAIAGMFQHPRSDQGWAAFLTQETLAGRSVKLNGQGLQVRDLLDVDDLAELIIKFGKAKSIARRVYNVGGGPDRSLSLLEFFAELQKRGYKPKFEIGSERPSDQRIFVAKIEPLLRDLQWAPRYSLDEIIDRLVVNAQQSQA